MEMPAFLRVVLRDGRTLVKEKRDYEGSHTNPMPWEAVVRKFELLSGAYTDTALRREIVAAVNSLDAIQVDEVTQLLARVQISRA